MPHRSRVFKTRVLGKKIITYSGIFNPYSDVLKPYSGVFLQKIFSKYQVWEPYSGVFKPYSDVFMPYSSVFMSFMVIESLKLNFHVGFFHIVPIFLQIETKKLEFYLRTRFLETQDAIF